MERNAWRAFACAGMLVGISTVATAQSQTAWWGQHRAPAGAEEAGNAASNRDAGVAAEAAAPPQQPAVLVPATLEVGARFDCVEVRRFHTETGFITSKESARAATIPADKLAEIQRSVAGNIAERIPGLKSTLAENGPACPDPGRAIVLDGTIIDFKKGNQALRYFVGFGAGAQKFSVTARATRKSDGALIGEGDVTDRKIGGWVGGQADKGLDDFAEKVADFLDRSLRQHG